MGRVVSHVLYVRWGGETNRDDELLEDLARGYSMTALPFEVFGDEADLSALAEGIWEEMLSRMAGERAAADRDALHSHAGTAPCEAAEDLDARWVFTGSVRLSGQSESVNADLWDCPDRNRLWSQTYEHPLADIARLPEELARNILTNSDQAGDQSRYIGIPGSVGWLVGRRTEQDNQAASRLLRRGLEKWPSSAALLGLTMFSNLQALLEGWAESPEEAVAGRSRPAAQPPRRSQLVRTLTERAATARLNDSNRRPKKTQGPPPEPRVATPEPPSTAPANDQPAAPPAKERLGQDAAAQEGRRN